MHTQMMANANTDVRKMMDERAGEIIGMLTNGRLASISFHMIQEEIWGVGNITGSMAEGMPTFVCSDMDVMLRFKEYPIVCWDTVSRKETVRWGFVEAEQNIEEPAYVKLKVLDEETLFNSIKSISDSDGYLKSTDFMQLNYSLLKTRQYNMKIKGPSFASKHGDQDFLEVNGENQDYVFCLKCQSWPPITDHFFTRKRVNDWPSKELLDEVWDMDCLVVAVANPKTSGTSTDTEWRLSFSLAERKLVQEIGEPMAKCMFVLKAIKNKYIKYTNPNKPFCSYFIKTACLWGSEEIEHEGYNVMDLTRKLLDWLIDCYQNKKLPHYFIPQQNLIGHLPRTLSEDVCTQLTAVKKELWNMVMSSFEFGLPGFKKVINENICDRLKIARVTVEDDYKKLEFNLLNHPKAIELMQSELCFGIRIAEYSVRRIIEWIKQDMFALDALIMLWIKKNVDFAEIFRRPEEIMLPIIENIEAIVMKGYESIYKTRLYRYLGDVYTHLLVCLRNRCPDEILMAYRDRPLHYYTLGDKMIWPDGWSDDGIGSRALVVKFHYLMGNNRDFIDTLNASDSLNITEYYRLPALLIFTPNSLSCRAWTAADELLVKCLPNGSYHYFNPLAVLFYIEARVSLNDGDIDKATKVVRALKLGRVLRKFPNDTDTDTLINVLESLIGLLRVMRMIYF